MFFSSAIALASCWSSGCSSISSRMNISREADRAATGKRTRWCACRKWEEPYPPSPAPRAEEEDNTEVADGFLQGLAALRDPIGTYRFHSAAHISDAHGTSESVSVNLAECLYLHRAGEGNHCVGHQVPAVRHKANEEEKKNLNNKNQLPPVDFADVLESLPGSALAAATPRAKDSRGTR